VLKCDTTPDEHSDSERFRRDVEAWIGQPVKLLRHPKYRTVEDVWRGERYIVGPNGASCTRVLKREVREAYQQPGDQHVFGLTYDEADRISDLEAMHPGMSFLWLLTGARITKEDCYHVLTTNGIELPLMYRMGYDHNNCLGCVKGGKGYQNKIRRDFPEVFARRAAIQRELGVQYSSGGELYWLDELDPDAGRDVPEPPIECGLFCGHYSTLIDLAVRGKAVPS
jgi:hypothetical protein